MFSKTLFTVILTCSLGVVNGFSGRATFDNAGLGSCGVVAQDSDHVVALSAAQYSGGAACGRQIVVTHSGKSVTARVYDQCVFCSSSGDIDLSPSAFEALASLDQGIIDVTWDFA
ncbi:RlpA-like double-psi beta-barrel-protein domain-containing protein-containing protein [Lenzites betulinus]|nr:RlpA-like double-psi beta-barrel-protein domain-containing protein-containing protein [Lenzites betulinus]